MGEGSGDQCRLTFLGFSLSTCEPFFNLVSGTNLLLVAIIH